MTRQERILTYVGIAVNCVLLAWLIWGCGQGTPSSVPVRDADVADTQSPPEAVPPSDAGPRVVTPEPPHRCPPWCPAPSDAPGSHHVS